MDAETGCLSCRGTGMILAPARWDDVAHAYSIVCGCGILPERFPQFSYQTGMTLPFITHRQAMAMAMGWVAWVDAELKEDIENLWTAGIETVSSCQDNPKRMIMIRDAERVDEARRILGWVQVISPNGANWVLREYLTS